MPLGGIWGLESTIDILIYKGRLEVQSEKIDFETSMTFGSFDGWEEFRLQNIDP